MPAHFTFSPPNPLFDQTIVTRLTGLAPHQPVTIRARRGDWSAQADFAADSSGVVDLSAQAPVSGDYDGIDPMGLFWSQRYADPAKVGFGMMWGELIDPEPMRFTAEAGGATLAEGSVTRTFIAPGVQRVVVRDDGLRGVLFLPATPAPHPAIIMVSGSGGGLNEHRAALFAAHGYAALALAYFNYEDLPGGLVEIPLEYFRTAIRYLQARPDIDGERIAYTGGSRGGELSLLLGATFPEIRAVVAYVPSGYVWDGVAKKPEDLGKRAWTYEGKPITSVIYTEDPEIEAQSAALAEQGLPIPLTPGFRAAVRSATNLREATIPVEKINGAVLLISGADDAMWPSATFADEVMERLRAANFPHPYEHLRYPDAGHLILTPHVPTTVQASGHPIAKSFFAYGGTPKGGAFANADSWARVLTFLDTHLKG